MNFFQACFCINFALFGLSEAFNSHKASFQVRYQGEISPYNVNAVFLLPGEILTLEALDQGTKTRTIKWKAPESIGVYSFFIPSLSNVDSVCFNIFVMVPASELKGGYLRGYPIGDYPSTSLKNLDFYKVPRGFIKMDFESAKIKVSPHFTLGQFFCKQSMDLPAYLFLKERLLLKLEWVLERANAAGFACSTFTVMGGYRTPHYNSLLGNVRNSSHQFGGAADIFIDANPKDGKMDDLNGDGKSNQDDAQLLFDLADATKQKEYPLDYMGGISIYPKTPSHGPFVHIDVRGFQAIW